MVLTEISITISAMVLFYIIIRRKKLIIGFKKRTLFDKIMVPALLGYFFLANFISSFFLFHIPFNPFIYLPYEVLIAFNPLVSLICLGFATLKWFLPDYKSTKPKTKFKRVNEEVFTEILKKHLVAGSGEKNNPFIVEESSFFPQDYVVTIKNSNKYMIFKNHRISSLKFKKCSNIIFENCNDSVITLFMCKDIKIKNCNILKLELNKCVHVLVEGTSIKFLQVIGSFLNKFTNSSVFRISKRYSPDNEFNIKEQIDDQGRKSNVFQNNVPTIMILSIFLVLVGNYLYITTILGGLNWLIILICSMILIFGSFFLCMALLEMITLQKMIIEYYGKKIPISYNLKKLILGSSLFIAILIVINLIYSLEYMGLLPWLLPEYRMGLFLGNILFSAILMTVGVNLILKSIKTVNLQFIQTANPLYPLFLYFNLFFILTLTNIYIGNTFDVLWEFIWVLEPLILSLLGIDLMISILVIFKYRKMKHNKKGNKFKSFFSISLIGISFVIYGTTTFTVYSLPYIIAYYILTLILGLLGVYSLPKFGKILSATLYQQKGKYDKSVKTFQSALQDEPQNEVGWYNLGMTYFHNEEYLKALEALKKVIVINPNNIKALIGIGYAAADFGDFDLAINSCMKALDCVKNPKISTATKLSEIIAQTFKQPVTEEYVWQCLSYIHNCREDYESAINTGKKAVELAPNFKEAWVTLAKAYNGITDFENAIYSCNKALEIDTNFAPAWNDLGLAYQIKGDLDLSLEMMKKAVELSPKEHQIWLNQAKILLKRGEFSYALKSINTSIKIKPTFEKAIELRRVIYKLMAENKDQS